MYQPFTRRKEKLSVHNGALWWLGRMIIPEKLRDKILKRLHEGHLGINAMKGICRHYIWWPGMNKEIEDVTTCRY